MATKKTKKKDTPKKPKFTKKAYPLKQDVAFSDGIKKKGEKVYLTEEGRKYFKSQNYIE